MKSKRIVITGGPGTGKTSVIQQLEAQGFPCFHEIIREMTSAAKKNTGTTKEMITNPLVFVEDAYQFNKNLLQGRVQHFQKSMELSNPVIFFDRGIPDVLAYMDFFDQPYGKDFTTACEQHQYDKIFMLPPWEAIYVSDNERLESFEEAIQIHEALEATYQRFGYKPIALPKDTVANRTDFIVRNLQN
ncbi:MAG: ATP-binding protein [Bacteroidota bacterium]